MAQSPSTRGISLDPLHPNISQLIEKYESANKNDKTSEIIKEMHGRTPWVSISSNAVVGGQNGKNYELRGDWEAVSSTKMAGKRTDVTTDTEGPKGMGNYMYYGGKTRGLPKAGVVSLDIDAKGGLGSIRYGKIKLKCFTAQDLAKIEKYYMVPGLRVLVQWGWSTYDGDPINLWDDKYNHGSGEMDIQLDICKRVLGVKTLYDDVPELGTDRNKPGRYDALIGLITKFNWSIDEAGAYDIEVEVTSTNGMLLTMPMDTAVLSASIITTTNTFTDGWDWPWGPGDSNVEESEEQKISDVEGILFLVENSSGKGTWEVEGGDTGTWDFDGSSVTKQSTIDIADYAKEGMMFSFGKTMKGLGGAEQPDNEDQFQKLSLRPILTTKAAKSAGGGYWSKISKADRTIMRGPFTCVEHGQSFCGIAYGYQAGMSKDGEVADPQWQSEKLGTFVSWRFIEDVIINLAGLPKNGEGNPVVGISSTHEVFPIEMGDSSTNTSYGDYDHSHRGLSKGMKTKRFLSNMCINHPHLRSTNPDVCFLPGQSGMPCSHEEAKNIVDNWCPDVNKEKSYNWFTAGDFMYWAINYGRSRSKSGVTTNSPTFGVATGCDTYRQDDTGARSFYQWSYKNKMLDVFATDKSHTAGYIRNIMVNTKFVKETYRNNPTLEGFVKGLLDGINNACGNVWDFSIRANPNDNGLIQVTDNNMAEGLARQEKNGVKTYQLTANNVSTIITGLQLTSKLPDAIKNAAMCAMCATEPENTGNEDSAIFKLYGVGVQDRFTMQAKEEWVDGAGGENAEQLKKYKKAKKKKEEYEKKVEESGKSAVFALSIDEWEDYRKQLEIMGVSGAIPPDFKYKNFCYNYWYMIITGATEDRQSCADTMKEYIKSEMMFGAEAGLQTTLLPMELSFDIEGISGFYMGNAISLAPQGEGGVLPDRYAGQTLFQVSKVNHKIDREAWKTSVECLMRQTNEVIPKKSKRIIDVDPVERKQSTGTTPVGDYKPPKAKGLASEYLNYASLKATYKKLNYPFKEDGFVNSAAIRIADLERSGKPEGVGKGYMGYIDWFCLAYKEDGNEIFKAFPCTTLPGLKPLKTDVPYTYPKGHPKAGQKKPGWAILKAGFWKAHVHGSHGGKSETYRAGAHRSEKRDPPGILQVYRDGNKDLIHDLASSTLEDVPKSINIHRSNKKPHSGRVGNFSHGCQVFLNDPDFQQWRTELHRNPKSLGGSGKYEIIDLALIDEGNMEIVATS